MNQTPPINTADALLALAQQIRAQRKTLSLNAVAVAEAAGISRVTLHRIERAEPTVSMGAYMSVLLALGMNFGAHHQAPVNLADFIPMRIQVEKYPQLKKLAWQIKAGAELTPMEAYGIYARNARHINPKALEPHEQQLIDALSLGLGEVAQDV